MRARPALAYAVTVFILGWCQFSVAAEPVPPADEKSGGMAARAAALVPPQVSGYIQVDYVASAESRDQLNDANQLTAGAVLNSQGALSGSTGQSSDVNSLLLNQDRFVLRRARVRVADELRRGAFAADYVFQLDANSLAGLALGVRDAEAGLSWTSAREGSADPEGVLKVRLGGGVFRSPFGYDVATMTHNERLFSEPTLLANAFFPGDYDLGARLQIDYDRLFAVVAVQNGEPIGGRPFPSRDPNSAKDVFLRLGGQSALNSWLRIEGAMSLLEGTGFHPGTPPTKDSLVWRDFNEDGIAQPLEIQTIRGASATASENFDRWAVGADLRADIGLPIGKLSLFGEGATGVNIDRGLRPADPVLSGGPQRGITVHGGFMQEIGRVLLVGARADHYDARIDATDTQGGRLVRAARPFSYYSFAAALRFLESDERRGRARLMFEYAVRRDRIGRDASGRPTDLADDRFTARLQVEF